MDQWERKTITLHARHEFGQLETDSDPISWIYKHSKPNDLMLAHALDGVIWGRANNSSQNWEHPPMSPPLRLETLQQIRVFNSDSEFYAWKTHNTWYFRLIEDSVGDIKFKAMDESHILSGTSNQDLKTGFTKLTHGEEGLIHAPPLAIATDTIHPNKPYIRVRLVVRNYLGVDEDSATTTIIASRLVNVEDN